MSSVATGSVDAAALTSVPNGNVLDFGQAGVTGLRQFSGWVYEEFLPDLQGYRGRQVYREMMDNDPVIGAFLFAVEMLIRRVEWRVDPGDETPEAEEETTLVTE